jgi:hypothetical protein
MLNVNFNNTIQIVLEKNGVDIQYNFCRDCIEWIKCKSLGNHEGAEKYNHSIKYCNLPHYFKMDHEGKPLCGYVLNRRPCPDGEFCNMNHPKNYPKISRQKKIKIINNVCYHHAQNILKKTYPCIFGGNCLSNHSLTETLIKSNYCINFMFNSCNNRCKRLHYSKNDLSTLLLNYNEKDIDWANIRPINHNINYDINSISNILSCIDISLSDKDKYQLEYDIGGDVIWKQFI